MMNTLEIISMIGGGLGIIAAVFAVFNYFRTPQETGVVNDAVFDEKILGNNRLYDEKFGSLEKLVINLRDNHIHTIGEDLKKHIESQTINELSVARQLGGIDAKLDILLKNK